MDYGMTSQDALGDWKRPKKGPWIRPDYFMLMQQRFRLDSPAISVRAVPAHIAAFIDDLFLDSSVIKPVGDLYVGTHAGSAGFLKVRLFRDQLDANGKPAEDFTDYEILDQIKAPKIYDSLVGYHRGTPPAPDPPPTHSVHIKGCNIGRDRIFPRPSQPVAPFLAKMKQTFGGNVNITAPKHFHGLFDEVNHQGIFEYMLYEFVVHTKAVKVENGFKGSTPQGFRGFVNRNELLAAYEAENKGANPKFRYYDGTPVPDADWDTILVPKGKVLNEDRNIAMTVSIGQTIENVSSIPITKGFRIEIESIDWTLPAGVAIPKDPSAQMDVLRASIAADPRFAATHPWPIYERRGYKDLKSYIDGHDWTFPKKPSDGDNLVVGRAVEYTILQPIVDRSITPPAEPRLVFNFYPGPGSSHAAVLSGLVESDNHFFGRA
jgi:hypothetical protein